MNLQTMCLCLSYTTYPLHLPQRLLLTTSDVLKVNSIGPEVINGRLAMIGMIAAAVVEPSGDQTLPPAHWVDKQIDR
jgi:hypothetical protein